jgi:hypothetical protein
LLALSPTGTGENYVGLEISNASSYGNNETVQLSDIHKVTYRYAFTVVDTVLNFPALGGYPTPRWFGLGTTKQKQIDGVAIGDTISVGYTQSAYPDWIVYDEGYKASGNTTLNQRSASLTFTQNESGKQITVQFTQDAGVETWEYTFTSKNNSLVFNAIGGKGTPTELTITSNKQKYINGKAVGSPVNVDYSRPSLPSWLSVESGYYEALENKSESSRSYTDTLTQAESGKKLTPVLSQAAGVKTYGTPTVYLGSIADIPASGGTAATPTYTYSQLWGWNGKTNDGGTISSGASVVWSENISGSNLGTTAKARTKLGSRTLTVTLNGKSGNASIDIYQAENKITNVTQGTWVVSISANPSTFTEQGGTSQISASARASRTNHWSSGATNAASDATGTPTLSIPTAVTGFSLSGTTLTVAENTTANQRSVVVRATMDTVYKEVTVTQSSYLVEWRYTFTASPTTLNFDALGTAKSITITSYREKYINGSLVEGSRENVSYIHATSTEHIGTVLGTSISMQENQTTSTRDGKVSYEQNGSNKVIQITCNQAAGTITQQWVLREVSGFNTIPAVGGQVVASVESGYYDVINGTLKTWHNEAPEVDTNPGWISLTSVEYANNGYYTVKATGISNGSESSRSGKLTLTNSQKSLQLDIVQSGASIGYNYYFEVTSDFPSVAAAGATPRAVIKSRRYRVVNGVEESSYTRVDVSLFSKPNWTGVLSSKVSSTTGPGADYDVTLPVYENTSESIRNGAVVLQQSGSNKRITLLINQSAAVVTWDYTFSIYSPSSKILNVPAKTIDPDTIICNSYRTKVVNGTQTSTKEFVEVTIDTIEENWLEVTKNSNDMTQVEFSVTCLENMVSSIRSATVTLRQVGSNKLDQVDINQSAATVSYNYYIGFNGNPDVGGYSMNWEYTQFGSSHGQSIDLKCWRKPVINGIESDTEEAAEYEVIFSGVGIDSFTVTNTPLSYDPTITTVRAYPKSINGSVFDLKGTVQYRIADYPSKSAYLYLTHKPVATVKRWTFQWYDQVESVTIKNVSHDSSAGSISPITIISKCEYLLASNQSQVAYTEYIKPNEDEDTATPVSWGRLLENGQTVQNNYDYAYLVDENKEDYDRQATRTFTQPGNPSNKRLYLYVTQTKPVTIKQEFHAELGNYYSYGDSNQIPLIYQWYSPDSSDATDIGDMTPGGYTGVWCNLPATGVINCMITGKPQTGKPMKARLSNLQARTIEDLDSSSPTETNKGLSVGYSQQDYQMGIEYSPGMNNYFLITPSILSESGAYGGGIRLEVSLRSSYPNSNNVTIATVTLTPKNFDHPTIHFEVIYG